jgi:hypothetical protein
VWNAAADRDRAEVDVGVIDQQGVLKGVVIATAGFVLL